MEDGKERVIIAFSIKNHPLRRDNMWKVRWNESAVEGYGSEADTWEPATSFVRFVQQDWRRWNKDNGRDLSLSQL